MSSVAGLAFMAVLFTASVLLVGGRDGARCLAMLGGCVVFVTVGAWASATGRLPVLAALPGCALGCLVVVVCVSLPDRPRRLAALAGGTPALLVPAVIAAWGVADLRITGAWDATMRDLWFGSGTQHLPLHRVAFGVVVLAGTGAVADLAVAVTAVMSEVLTVRPDISAADLARAGRDLGGDVTGTELNTLVYAFLGLHFGAALLPLAEPDVRASVVPWLEALNRESVAVEALAAFAGTAGLLAAIPLTAWAGSRILTRGRTPCDPS